jgi:trans-aconitate methyltransferase
VDHASLNARLTPLNGSVYDWLHLFGRNTFLKDLPDEEAKEVMREVDDVLRVDCCDADGKWAMMYTRLRFVAVRM